MNNFQWETISQYVRNKLSSLCDPKIVSPPDLSDILFDHKGFYVGLVDPANKELVREGFLREDLKNVSDSVNEILPLIMKSLKEKEITIEKAQASKFHFCLVTDVVYIMNPLDWNENSDGIYFQWGQKYSAFYLPYQIQNMKMSKIEILDRLCCHEAGVVANLWRLPEGLIYVIKCLSYSS